MTIGAGTATTAIPTLDGGSPSEPVGAVQTRSRAGCDNASLRLRSSVCAPTPTARASPSTDALSRGSSLATTRSSDACPYRAISSPLRRPQSSVPFGAATILTWVAVPAARSPN
jgi:hypothetical protein